MRWLLFAWRNVLRNRRRALVTVLITAVGTSAILISGGFALYTYDSLREMAARESGHIVVAHRDYFEQEEQKPLELGISNYQNIIHELEKDMRIRMVLPRINFSGLITNGEKSSIFVGSGVDPKGEFYIKGPFFKIVSGSTLALKPDSDADPQVMLGKGLAKAMNAKVGDSLTLLASKSEGGLNAQDVIVQGIFSIGVPELDKRAMLSSLGSAQFLLQSDRISTLSVYLTDTELTPAVHTEISQHYGDFSFQPWWDQAFYYFAVRDLYNRIFGLLGIIIISMVFFAVSNTLSMSIVERTREIGTLRALGTSTKELIRNFLLEAVFIGTSGVFLGMLFAAATAFLVLMTDIQMPPPPARSESYPLVIYIDTSLYLYTALTIVLVSIVSAWYISHRAVHKPIVEALSHV